MRTAGTLSPRLASVLGAAIAFTSAGPLGCGTSQDLGTRPTADASPDDSGLGDDSSPPAPDAGVADAPTDTSAPPADADTDAGTARIVLFGGTDGVNDLNDTWTFDGTQWTLINTTGPSARSGMVVATVGGKVVLFGGGGGTEPDGGPAVYDDTWTFDGATWTKLSTPTTPGARSGAGAAVIGGALYLFGGGDANATFTDIWKFDGTSWTPVTTQGPPAPTPTRTVFAMGSMAGGQEALFFGGDTSTGDFLNDTWTFDGTRWAQVTTAASPSARGLAVIVPWSGGALQWGGNTAVGPNDTWTFDGANWTQVNVAPPGGSNGPCGASAAVLGSKVFLFGGYCSAPADTTYEFDGTRWSLVDLTSHPFVPSPRTGAGMATLP